jgi:hypothetical protein
LTESLVADFRYLSEFGGRGRHRCLARIEQTLLDILAATNPIGHDVCQFSNKDAQELSVYEYKP